MHISLPRSITQTSPPSGHSATDLPSPQGRADRLKKSAPCEADVGNLEYLCCSLNWEETASKPVVPGVASVGGLSSPPGSIVTTSTVFSLHNLYSMSLVLITCADEQMYSVALHRLPLPIGTGRLLLPAIGVHGAN